MCKYLKGGLKEHEARFFMMMPSDGMRSTQMEAQMIIMNIKKCFIWGVLVWDFLFA